MLIHVRGDQLCLGLKTCGYNQVQKNSIQLLYLFIWYRSLENPFEDLVLCCMPLYATKEVELPHVLPLRYNNILKNLFEDLIFHMQ